ncbi:hypothetical protein FRB99_003069 [Tulasnella sp. 403]|nr:hypothetical protein FRB99_003069 [Tulasnella sp. 403]
MARRTTSKTWEDRYHRLGTLLKAPTPIQPVTSTYPGLRTQAGGVRLNQSVATTAGGVEVDFVTDPVGLALDQFVDSLGQRKKSSREPEVENLRFGNKDLSVVGTLTKGQFGTIHVVQCHIDDAIYARKSITKSAAKRFRQQCSVQCEREILMRARTTQTAWVPHLLCTFQTPSDLNFVMEYEEGGSLEGVLECAPEGRVDEQDMLWWIPQAVSAISWCHEQQFVHRDIKPQNFVITANAHLKLIDFGSAAPLGPPDAGGVQLAAKKYCLMPCGTVDYIAPEILQVYEEALVALDLNELVDVGDDSAGYGKEVDWWSLGAMMYELVCGQAPFFAEDIGQTYQKVMSHTGDTVVFMYAIMVGLHPRGGMFYIYVSTAISWLLGMLNEWSPESPPPDLAVPDFSYTPAKPLRPLASDLPEDKSSSDDGIGFQFSMFFQSSPGLSILQASTMTTPASALEQDQSSPFLGFTWGPPVDAFTESKPQDERDFDNASRRSVSFDKQPSILVPASPYPRIPGGILKRSQHRYSDPTGTFYTYATPIRPGLTHYPTTIPRTGTCRKVRPVSDREALRQMMMHVGMSAKKKVAESTKKPRNSTSVSFAPLPAFDPDAEEMPSQTRASLQPLKMDIATALSQSIMSESTAPPSPSPRPGSAMSRRSATPGLTGTFRSISNLTAASEVSGNRSGRSKDYSVLSKGGNGARRAPMSRSSSGGSVHSHLLSLPKISSLRLEPLDPSKVLGVEESYELDDDPTPRKPIQRPKTQSFPPVIPKSTPQDVQDLLSAHRFDELEKRLDRMLSRLTKIEATLQTLR